MIYFKVLNKIFKESELDQLKGFLSSYYSHDLPWAKQKYLGLKALLRITRGNIKKHFSSFPDIDIYLSDKNNKRICGIFYHGAILKKEYRRTTRDPFLTVFYIPTLNSNRARVKAFNHVLIHEFLHYKQWLTGSRLGHGAGLGHVIDHDNLEAIKRLI